MQRCTPERAEVDCAEKDREERQGQVLHQPAGRAQPWGGCRWVVRPWRGFRAPQLTTMVPLAEPAEPWALPVALPVALLAPPVAACVRSVRVRTLPILLAWPSSASAAVAAPTRARVHRRRRPAAPIHRAVPAPAAKSALLGVSDRPVGRRLLRVRRGSLALRHGRMAGHSARPPPAGRPPLCAPRRAFATVAARGLFLVVASAALHCTAVYTAALPVGPTVRATATCTVRTAVQIQAAALAARAEPVGQCMSR